MKIAFYAPLKPPDHPIPSGDRLIANLLLDALRLAGHAPALAARFRSYEGQGNAQRQRRLRVAGERLAQRLIRRLGRLDAATRPRCWVTYHLYHKAPDWIGPAVTRALRMPYVVVEASVAPKQKDGPWREGYLAATEAIAGADLVISNNRSDMPGLEALLGDPRRLVRLEPFLDLSLLEGDRGGCRCRGRIASKLRIPADESWLITVAMMRGGSKLDSYRVLARALAAIRATPWHLLVVGDGPARAEVEAAFKPIGPSRVTFLGLLPREEIAALLLQSDVFLWPAVAESVGMAILEALAAGLPVAAGNDGGVADIVRNGETGFLTPPGDAEAFAGSVSVLLGDVDLRQAMGERARARARKVHSLEAAAAALDRWLADPTRGAGS